MQKDSNSSEQTKRRCVRQKHGMTRSPEYKAWAHIKERCFKQSCSEYHNYGARGITMCEAWRHSFLQFYSDVGPRPSSGHSLDRIDNDGDYAPGNVRWATISEQLNNTRQCRYVDLGGHRVTVAEAARRLGVNEDTFRGRLNRGYSVEAAAKRVSYPDKGCRRPPQADALAQQTRRSAAH